MTFSIYYLEALFCKNWLVYMQVSCGDWFGFGWASNAGDGLDAKWLPRDKQKEQIIVSFIALQAKTSFKGMLDNDTNGKTGAIWMHSFSKKWKDMAERKTSKWQHFFHCFARIDPSAYIFQSVFASFSLCWLFLGLMKQKHEQQGNWNKNFISFMFW